MLIRSFLALSLLFSLSAEASNLIDGLSADNVVGAPHFLNEQQVVYSVDRGGRIDVMIRDLSLGKTYRFASHPLDDRSPKFSVDGKYVAWIGQRNDVKGDLFLGETPKDSRPTRITSSEEGVESFSWSFDGASILYVTRDPFLDTRRGFHYSLESEEIREIEHSVSKAIAGCSEREWLLVEDFEGSSTVFRYQEDSSDSTALLKLDGLINELVSLGCDEDGQKIYVSLINDDGRRRGQKTLSVGLLSLSEDQGENSFEHLIGESLPRLDFASLSGEVVGRVRPDSRQFVRTPLRKLERYLVDRVKLELLGGLKSRERLNVLDAKEVKGELSDELASFYRFLTYRDARKAAEASSQLEVLWQRGCRQAYELAAIYLRRTLQAERDDCTNLESWKSRLAFAKADELMFRGEVEKSNTAFQLWLTEDTEPFLRFIGLTRWTRLATWISPLDSLLQVLEFVEHRRLALDAIEKEWFFNALLGELRKFTPQEYSALVSQWPSILNDAHIGKALTVMFKARRYAAAKAWAQAFDEALNAKNHFESRAGKFYREWQTTQWMLRSGQPRRALAMLQALELNYPEEREALRELRSELRGELNEFAESAEASGDASAAYALYSQLLILEPNDLELMRKMLAQAGPAGFLGQKLAQFNTALAEDTSGWLEHYLVGLALTFVDAPRLREAEKQLRAARELQPQSIDVVRTLSWVLLNREGSLTERLRRAEEVIDLVERQLSRMDEEEEGYRELEYSLSLALFRLGKFDRAQSIMKRFEGDFETISSERSAYLSLRADLAYRNGDNQGAVGWLEKLIADEELQGREHRLPELRARLGVVLYASQDRVGALEALEHARDLYLELDNSSKAALISRIVNLLREQPLSGPPEDSIALEAWKYSLRGLERILYIASTRAAAGEVAPDAEQESANATTAQVSETPVEQASENGTEELESKGVTLAPYGDELHWYQWSRATADYNRTARTFDLEEMEEALTRRVRILMTVWEQGVLAFSYLQEVRDILFDALELLSIRESQPLIESLESLLSALPSGVASSEAWQRVSAEVEAYVLRDLSEALNLCGLERFFRLGDDSTFSHACQVFLAASNGASDLERDLVLIDRLVESRTEITDEQKCSPNSLYENWTKRGFLPTDTIVLGRLLTDCRSVDAWQRTELLVGLEAITFQRGSSRRDASGISISPEQLTEVLVWALDDDIVYLGGIETANGWWFLEIGEGQTHVRKATETFIAQRLEYWAERDPIVSNSLAKFTHALVPSSWQFSHSLLAYWEQETWDGPAFIAVPESQILLEECSSSSHKPLKYESLVVSISGNRSLTNALLDVEKCLRGKPSFHRVVFEYESPSIFLPTDFERVVTLFRQRSRFPVDAIQLAYGETSLNLGPAPARESTWVRVWNEHFQPLFAAGLTARRLQQSKPGPESHRQLVRDVERIINVLDGLAAMDPETLNRYINLPSSRGTMFQQILSRLGVIRSQFLTWSVASYEALGMRERASQILGELLQTRAWAGDLKKLGLWSRKQASFLTAMEENQEAIKTLEACWKEGVVDCGVELGSRYLSQASYREAERIGDGLVGVSDNSRANVEGIDILARIAEQERYDFDAAVELLLRAYAISGDVDLDLRVRLSINLMRVARLAGDYQAAETLGDSVSVWELSTAQRLRVELTRAQTWYVSGQARKVVRSMAKLTNLAEDIGDRFTKMLCTSLWALSSLEVGRFQDAQRLAESALHQAEALGNRREIANQLNNLGLVYARLGSHEQASKALNAAMTSDFTGRDTMSLAYSMRNLGQQKILANEPEAASGLLEEAAYLSKRSGDRINEARARFSLLLNREILEEDALGKAFWDLSEDAKKLRLVEVQWRALFGAYRYLESSISEEKAITLLEEIFRISMSHIGLASERLGPGRRALRNEYHYRLMKAGRRDEAMTVALRFAQRSSQRGQRKPIDVKTLQERLQVDEALWYGWFDKRGWNGWVVRRESLEFVATDWDKAETERVFSDISQRFKEYAPLGRSLELLSDAFSFLMKDKLQGIRTLKILEVPGEHWVPYRALSMNGGILDEQVQLEWVLPLLVEPSEEPVELGLYLSDAFDDKSLSFANLEHDWLRERFNPGFLGVESVFKLEGQLHMTGHFNSLGQLEDAWFRYDGSIDGARWPERIFVNTCGPDGDSIRAKERFGALLTALQNGTQVALTHRLRVSDWAAAVLAKRYYHIGVDEEPSEVARRATRFVRRMFSHPAHWAGFEVISGL